MERLAQELRRLPVEVVVESIDLSAAGSAADLLSRLDRRGIEPDVLINNAGVGFSGPFVTQDEDRLRAMLMLNIVGLTELSHAYGRRMFDRGHGHILLVGSMAAYLPVPLMAAYAASKAYVLSLGEALNVEFAPRVKLTVLSPGLMDTGFNTASGYETPPSLKVTELPVDLVARIGLEAMFRGKSGVIAGRFNKIAAVLGRVLSRHFLARQQFNGKAS